MGTTSANDVDTVVTDDQPSLENYLPAGPKPSSEPGRVERFVTNLLRRRGDYRLVVRRAE
ncbi:MAG: hypothetical protein V5A44_11540 [Haloarculaceae archaeon]